MSREIGKASPVQNKDSWGLDDTGPRPSPALTAAVSQAIQALVQELDYDLHKSILCDEETGANGYPELAATFSKTLAEGGFGKLPAPWAPTSMSIGADGWLVEESTGCTCAGGTIDSNYAHEPSCGYSPIIDLTETLAKSGFVPLAPSVPAAITAAATAFLATPGDQPEKEREQEWAEHMMGPALAAAAPFYASQDQGKALAPIIALHQPSQVYRFDDVNGVFALDADGEKILMHKLCAECTSEDVLEALGDCEYTEGSLSGEVRWPCATYRAATSEGQES